MVTFSTGHFNLSIYAAILALALNLVVSTALTLLLHALHISNGTDETTPADFETHPVAGSQIAALEAQIKRTPAETRKARETFHA